MNYSTVVTKLLEDWLKGYTKIEFELDAEFVEACTEVIESNEVQDALVKLAKHHKKSKRTYKNAVSI